MKKAYICRALALLVCLVTLLTSVSCKQSTPTDDYWSSWQDNTTDSTSADEPEEDTQTPTVGDPSEIDLIYAENVNSVALWEIGSLHALNGENLEDEARIRIRTKAFFDIHRLGVIRSEKLEFTLCAYAKVTGDYIGAWTGTTFTKDTKEIIFVDLFREFELCENYDIKLIARMKDGTTVDPEDAADIECLPLRWESDAWSGGLTFIEESGSMEAVRRWEQIADTCGIRVTFAVETGKIGTEGYLTWSEMTRLQSKGFAFVACLPADSADSAPDATALEAELAGAVAAFAEHHIENHILFYSELLDADSLAVVKRYFQAAVTVGDAVNAIPLNTYALGAASYTDPDAMREITVGDATYTVHALRSTDALHALLDGAAVHDSWVIYRTHFENDYANGNACDEEMLQSVIDLCRYAVQNGMQILTLGDGYGHFKNRLEIGSIADGNYYIVDHNGKAHEGKG